MPSQLHLSKQLKEALGKTIGTKAVVLKSTIGHDYTPNNWLFKSIPASPDFVRHGDVGICPVHPPVTHTAGCHSALSWLLVGNGFEEVPDEIPMPSPTISSG